MSCQVEQIADCGDLSSLGRALFISEKEGIELVFTNHQDCHLVVVISLYSSFR